jgi:tRNA 2-selenouridine synthase
VSGFSRVLDRPARRAPQPSLVVLTGYAGSGKTETLEALATLGEPVLDLERLACHRGSAFGALGQPPQPSHDRFARLVRRVVAQADPTRPLWVEDEGPFIGSVGVPPELQQTLATAPVVRLELPFERRVERLIGEYGRFPPDDLTAAIRQTAGRLGPARTHQALRAVHAGSLCDAVAILLGYYDAGYDFRWAMPGRSCLGVVTGDRPALDRARAAVALVRG